MTSPYSYLFGPVPSRRLGRSLGVDLTPFKTCSLDCVFCQLGRTPKKMIERKEYVPAEDVISELAAWSNTGGKADVVTLSGSGEPTLHRRFGEVLQAIHRHTSLPAVLLSNGTMFDKPEVRAAATQADIVKLSLSAWDSVSFARVHRPHPGVHFDGMLEGYRAFRSAYAGQLWLEVFLVPGLNSALEQVDRIAALAASIRPDAIHLNTAVRPPAETGVRPLPRRKMEPYVELFRPRALVTAEFTSNTSSQIALNEDAVAALLKRRPCTARQIADVFGMHLNEVSKYLGKLVRTGRAQSKTGAEVYYSGVKNLWHGHDRVRGRVLNFRKE